MLSLIGSQPRGITRQPPPPPKKLQPQRDMAPRRPDITETRCPFSISVSVKTAAQNFTTNPISSHNKQYPLLLYYVKLTTSRKLCYPFSVVKKIHNTITSQADLGVSVCPFSFSPLRGALSERNTNMSETQKPQPIREQDSVRRSPSEVAFGDGRPTSFMLQPDYGLTQLSLTQYTGEKQK